MSSRFLAESDSHVSTSSGGISATSTLPLSNSATAVLGSAMMRASSESVFGAPPQYASFRANSR